MALIYTYLYPISDSGLFFQKTIHKVSFVEEGIIISFSLYNRYPDQFEIPISINDEMIIHRKSNDDPTKVHKKSVFSEYVVNDETNKKMYGYGDDHYAVFQQYETKDFSVFFRTDQKIDVIDLSESMLPEKKPYGNYRIRISVKENKLDSIYLKKKYKDYQFYEPKENGSPVKEKKKESTGLTEKVTCPCCREEVGPDELKQTLEREVVILGGTAKPQMKNLAGGYYHWACDKCLNSGKALIANHDNFAYGNYGCYLAFYDIEMTCKSCREKYIFTKEEQAYWFEQLHFCHRAKSVRCIPCRKKIRYQNLLNKKLSELLANKKDFDIKKLENIINIYIELGKPEKTNYYSNLLQKMIESDKR